MTTSVKNQQETSKYEASKARENETRARINKIKDRLSTLESERLSILRSSPKASVLYDQWKANIEYLQREFVSELSERVYLGRDTRIRFDTPGAMAYINGDRWIDAIAGLAQQLGEDARPEGRSMTCVSDEITLLRHELGSLGGF